ncbi:OLC1v1017482C1 [Oldenlandia corymbosa var. corymbosa]|uniref:OLC1v1017482C1 n=1 Tax=Oldenlandia corymbosa var. corymbosa TaxID=529605 RepID=A0AAV1E9K1_OLDCO|nr:OLC1v1017482C1 [Oldenlandia corymbosa var. corymbosa]
MKHDSNSKLSYTILALNLDGIKEIKRKLALLTEWDSFFWSNAIKILRYHKGPADSRIEKMVKITEHIDVDDVIASIDFDDRSLVDSNSQPPTNNMTDEVGQKTELNPFELVAYLEQHEEIAPRSSSVNELISFDSTYNGAQNPVFLNPQHYSPMAISGSNSNSQMYTAQAAHNGSRDAENTQVAPLNVSSGKHQPTTLWFGPDLQWSPPAHSLPLRAPSNYQGLWLGSDSRPGTIRIGTGPNTREIMIPPTPSSRANNQERFNQEGERTAPNNNNQQLIPSRKRGRYLDQ